jgi:hypothetical protein
MQENLTANYFQLTGHATSHEATGHPPPAHNRGGVILKDVRKLNPSAQPFFYTRSSGPLGLLVLGHA